MWALVLNSDKLQGSPLAILRVVAKWNGLSSGQ
jgi:hypothetical protein